MIDPENNRITTRWLPGNAMLHHITNPKGEEWSAIYTWDGREVLSAPRREEPRLIADWYRRQS